jgi:hypothetical protein
VTKMKMNRSTRKWLVLSGLWVLALAGIASSFADERRADDHGAQNRQAGPERGQQFQRDGRGQVFDNRYNHGRYYPPRGQVVRSLPPGYRPYSYGGSRFFFNAGIWYAPGPYGFVVTRPPFGLYVNVLPPFYSTLWFGGVPYYYADDVYYQWRPDMNGYVVAAPPPGADQPSGDAPPSPASIAPGDDFYVYPRNGQTAEQQAADRYECHSWSKGQTGFDPTQPGGAVPQNQTAATREQYQRAITACLEARGYSVK